MKNFKVKSETIIVNKTKSQSQVYTRVREQDTSILFYNQLEVLAYNQFKQDNK